jgi:hypothetical protein
VSAKGFIRFWGISHHVSCPYAHQQNGSAKRKHHHIVEVGLALLAHASMPLKYWDESLLAATYLINRLSTKVLYYSSPLERLYHEKPNYSGLRTFGCACWPNCRPFNTHKLQFRSKQCVFFDYSNFHKGFKCLDVIGGRVYISRDVIFDETIYPFAKLNPNVGARLRSEILLLPLSSQPQNSPLNGVQILDESSIDMHLFPILANSPSASAAQEKNPVEFDARTRSGVDVEAQGSGAGLGMMCEGDYLARIVSGAGKNSSVDHAGADSSVDSPSVLTGAGAESCVDPAAPPVRMREDVRLSHASGADHSPGFSMAVSGNPIISLNRYGSSAALHPDGLILFLFSLHHRMLVLLDPLLSCRLQPLMHQLIPRPDCSKRYESRRFIRMAPSNMDCLQLQENLTIIRKHWGILSENRLWILSTMLS